MDDRDTVLRSLSLIRGIKNNLPNRTAVEARWVHEYNSALSKIEEAETISLNEYKIGNQELKRLPSSGNYLTGEIKYSKELFCDKSTLLHKVDSALSYLDNLQVNSNNSLNSHDINFMPSNRVFIVHGHNEAVKQIVARIVEKLDLEPIILHEQPNKGDTIIEKFIKYSDVNFAVVLLTADDVGAKNSGANVVLNPRARQNVILELGYFIGKLGRSKVCAIYEDGVEIPSDYQGVLFVKFDDGGNWKFSLAKELKAAGFDVDMNKII
jgi:predicted nucleotide-binding protein